MKMRWQDWVGLFFGAWIFFSPWIFSFLGVGAAAWNSWIIGIGVVVFFAIALAQPRIWEEWVNLLLAVWLFVAPFALGFSNLPAAAWNHWVLAILIAIDTIWAMNVQEPQRHQTA